MTILKNIRVLDFGRYIAGPYCAMLLASLGAEVIRIERPGGGEDRFMVPLSNEAFSDGSMFMQNNGGKKGMTLRLGKPAAVEIVQKLVKTADIVVANLPGSVLEKLGLDYESLRAIKPDIILVANSAFGSEGAWGNKPGFDGIGQTMSGAAWFSGTAGKPVKASVTYIDYSTALAATVGTLAAIMHRQQTGEGQVVETTLLGTALTLNATNLAEQAVLEINREPSGNRAQVAGPADIFATSDGHIIVQVVGPYIFKRFAGLMNRPEWLTDDRFINDWIRGEHRDILCPILAEWCKKRTSAEALAELEAHTVPAGPVLSFQESLDHEAVQALAHLRPIGNLNVPVAKAPFSLSAFGEMGPHRPPSIGEHSDLILIELGYTAAEISVMRAEKII
ncbi:MAG: crotonobetainyl-CoA:carnitine CoA-transferase CaiB-like acyl-CoA transferase [Cellvibrionaceae bacterium]|jgi:crotonobetainyl-CoA:carnitine CoA-transferase CaiB-like acyl-CoA transferase